MRVGFFQYAVIRRDRDANLSYIESKVKDEKFDLLVLPELFTSGYAFDKKEELLPFAEDLSNSPTVRFFTQLMQRCGGYITGGDTRALQWLTVQFVHFGRCRRIGGFLPKNSCHRLRKESF